MSDIQDFVANAHGDIEGPHGIPLRAHAEAGNAERVLALLDSGD